MGRPISTFPELTKSYLEDLYLKQNLSYNVIMRITGAPRSTIQRRFKQYKIPPRSMKEAAKLSIETGRQVVSSGERASNWKGGKRRHLGYVKVKKSDHPRADVQGYVFEHILVWEQTYGKPLPTNWVIHHLNGVKDDNRPENLLACPRKRHDNLIQGYKDRILRLETEVRYLRKELAELKGEAIKMEFQKITYIRQVRPPTLAQFVYRRAVREKMAEIKGKTGVTINPSTGIPIPESALAAKEALKGLTAEKIAKEHPEWVDEYNNGHEKGE